MKETHARWSFCLQRPLDHATGGPLRPLRANIHVVVLFTLLFFFHVQMHGVPCFFLPSHDICISSWSFVWTARSLLNCCVVLLLSVTVLGASFVILCVCFCMKRQYIVVNTMGSRFSPLPARGDAEDEDASNRGEV